MKPPLHSNDNQNLVKYGGVVAELHKSRRIGVSPIVEGVPDRRG